MTVSYYTYDASGTIKTSGIAPDTSSFNVPAGCTVAQGGADVLKQYVSNGALVSYTPTQAAARAKFPLYPARWDATAMAWVDLRDMSTSVADKNAEINAARMTANYSGFYFGGKLIATDPLSRSDIDGIAGTVALTGDLPTDFVGYWKAVDNTNVSIPNKATFLALYAAMVAQGSANFAAAQTLKTTLAAATTVAQVAAIAAVLPPPRT